MCRDWVDQGELVRLLPDLEIRTLDLNVFYPSKRSAAPVVRAFTELLRASLSFGGTFVTADTPASQSVDVPNAYDYTSAPLYEEPPSA